MYKEAPSETFRKFCKKSPTLLTNLKKNVTLNKIIITLIFIGNQDKIKNDYTEILFWFHEENTFHNNITRRKQHGNVSM